MTCLTVYKIIFKGNFHTLSKLAFYAFIMTVMRVGALVQCKMAYEYGDKCRTDEQKQIKLFSVITYYMKNLKSQGFKFKGHSIRK
jgi:hypothetical protein